MSVETLEMLDTYISIESLEFKPIIDKLMGIIPDMRNSFTTIINQFKIGDDINISDFSSISTKVKKVQYPQLKVIKLPCPQGLGCTYLHILQTIEPITHHLKGIYRDVLQPYNTFLASIATMDKARLDTKDFEKDYNKLRADREKHFEALSKCFVNSARHSEREYVKLFSAAEEWDECDKVSKICTDNMNSIDKEMIEISVKECNQYLEVMYDNLKGNPDAKASHEVAKRLSQGAYEIARELEFMSLIYFRLLTITENYTAAKDKMKKMI